MPPFARVIDNIGALFLRQFATWSFAAVLIIFVPRYLGDEGFGKITFATASVMVLLIFTNLGTATFTVKEVAVNKERLAELLWNSYLVRLLTNLAIVGLLAAVLPLLQLDSETRSVLYISGAMLFVMSMNRAQAAAIRGLEKMRWRLLHKFSTKAPSWLWA